MQELPPPTVTKIPDIEGDEGFQILIKNDLEIDEKLDIISRGVNVLGEMAREMGKEVELQGKMLEELDHKVETTTAQLQNLNKRLKNTLDKVRILFCFIVFISLVQVRSPDRCIIDCIIIIIILGIGGWIYNMLT